MTKPLTSTQPGEPDRTLMVITARRVSLVWLIAVVFCLSGFVLRTYDKIHDPKYGWSKLVMFGRDFAPEALPRLQRNAHYVDPSVSGRAGFDGQFYAQLAIDPSLRDPSFPKALDEPVYRARRIGLSAIAFALGGGKPRRIIQAYALSNLLFWFVLLIALICLFRPWTGRQLLCLSASLLSYGVIVSMERSLTDLPACAMIFAGAVIGSWGGYAAFAAAILTRETSVLAAGGFLDLRWPWRREGMVRNAGLLCVAILPLAVWLVYVRHQLGGAEHATGSGNITLPLQAMYRRFVDGMNLYRHTDYGHNLEEWRWLYLDNSVHELLTLVAIVSQGLFLFLRPDVRSGFWRTGICYLGLGCLLGPSVWEQTASAARVLLPMTLCFYLLLARERAVWFWPFFILGSLSVPYGVHDFWVFS